MSWPTDLASRVRMFEPTFEAGSAPLYTHLTRRAAVELEWSTSRFTLALEPFRGERPERLLWLRLLALVHRWVLAGEVPELAIYYPSAGGTIQPSSATWQLFRDTVIDRAWKLPDELRRPHQHNEVGRAGALAAGFLLVSRAMGMPLRLLEVGASAGLLLRWDHYLRCAWFKGLFAERPPEIEAEVHVAERRGCDLQPVDVTTAEGSLYLRSMVWADLVDHLAALHEAIAISAAVPAVVDQADGADWLPEHGMPRSGQATVVYHSLMRASGPPESLGRMDEAVLACSRVARADAPLAYLRFETGGAEEPGLTDPREMVKLRLTMWPGGDDRVLATSDVNGRHVKWLLTSPATTAALPRATGQPGTGAAEP